MQPDNHQSDTQQPHSYPSDAHQLDTQPFNTTRRLSTESCPELSSSRVGHLPYENSLCRLFWPSNRTTCRLAATAQSASTMKALIPPLVTFHRRIGGRQGAPQKRTAAGTTATEGMTPSALIAEDGSAVGVCHWSRGGNEYFETPS